MSPTAERIMGILRNARLPIEDELRLHEAIDELLRVRAADLRVLREQKIVGGRIDFAVEHGCRCLTGIEVKIRGGKRDIHRQLKGYCEDAASGGADRRHQQGPQPAGGDQRQAGGHRRSG